MGDKNEVKCKKLFQNKIVLVNGYILRALCIVGMIKKQETDDHVQKGFGSDEVT